MVNEFLAANRLLSRSMSDTQKEGRPRERRKTARTFIMEKVTDHQALFAIAPEGPLPAVAILSSAWSIVNEAGF